MQHDSQHVRVCALVLSVFAFFLFIAAETLQYEGQRTHHVVLTLVALGALGFAWIGPLTLLAGTLHSSHFKWWQPFEGGVEFVWMQAFGWSLDALVLAASVVILANFRVHEWFQGLYLLLGVSGFIAQILLNLSISSFVEGNTGRSVFKFRLNTKAVVSLLISASGTLMFVIYDVFSHLMQSSVIITMACSQFVISAFIIHVVYGCMDIPSFRLWQPFEGDRTFLLLQYLGWQFLACVIAASIIICFDFDAGHSTSKVYSVGSATTIGIMGFISQTLLLISLQFFERQESRGAITQRLSKQRSPEVMVSALLCFSAMLVGFISYVARIDSKFAQVPILRSFLLHERIWWSIGLVALVIASPIIQMGAVRTSHSFRWWQPFAGGTKFIFLQMIGWFWYGIFLSMVIVLWLNHRIIGQPMSIGVLVVGAASALMISLSLPYFRSSRHYLKRSVKSFDAKSEFAMFLAFALVCALFHVLVDVFHERMFAIARVICVSLGTAASVLGCTIMHMSGRHYHESYRFFQPFEGGTRFVIRQAVGWTLFAVQLLFDSLLLSLIAWQRAPVGVPSLIGFFTLIPHCLIASSIAYFKNDPSPEETTMMSQVPNAGWRVLFRDVGIRWRAIVNMVVAIGSIGLFVCAEVFHGSDRIRHAEEVLYLFGFLTSICGMVLGHCVLGPKIHPTYQLFQPFRGGTRFITLQGAAWTMMSMAWAVSCTVLYWNAEFFRVKGIHVMTGIIFFMAQLVLLYSLPLYRLSGSAEEGRKLCAKNEFRIHAEDWINQFLVGPLLGIAGCSVFVLVDLGMVYFGPSIPVLPVTICAVLALFSSIPMSYKFASSSFGARAKSFSGSIVFVVVGCALWSFTLLLAVVYCYNLWALESGVAQTIVTSKSPTAYMGTLTGVIGFVAQYLVLQAPGSRHSKHSDEPAYGILEIPRRFARWLEERTGVVGMWMYSFGGLVAWMVSGQLNALVPRHIGTNQVFSLVACALIVVVSAWWIQQLILKDERVLTQSKMKIEQESPNDEHPVLQLGFDCYVQMALFMSMADLVALSGSCKAIQALFTENFWRRVFFQQMVWRGQMTSNQTSVIDEWESKHSSSFTISSPASFTSLNRVESVIFNLICRFQLPRWRPFERAIPDIRSSKWKALCQGACRDFHTKHCVICDRWELFSAEGSKWEQGEQCRRRTPSTWITLCQCHSAHNQVSRRSAHRSCMEKSMAWLHIGEDVSFTSRVCKMCDIQLTEDTRFPASMSELLSVTWKDFLQFRQDFGEGFFIVVPSCSAVMATSVRSIGWGSWGLYIWVPFAVAVCFVAHSAWFDERFRRIGDESSTSFLAYQRLYHFMVMSSIFHVLFCSPLFYSETYILQILGHACFCVNFASLLVIGSAVLIVYWRSHYSIKTWRAVSPAASSDSTAVGRIEPGDHVESCIMCDLLICSAE